jgi:uncharacterized protein involved in response to NO
MFKGVEMSMIFIEEPGRSSKQADAGIRPVWRLGFRPFYLLGAVFAAVSVPAWLLKYYGYLSQFDNIGTAWHAHEMVFGFVVAIIIGFLYTAGKNWTGYWTPRDKILAALAVLWLAGRVAMLLAPPIVAAPIDLAFIPVAAWLLYGVLKKSANKKNLIMVGLLALLTLANVAYHAAMLGWAGNSPLHAIYDAILVIVILETIIGGRVIPMFTANAVPGVRPVMNTKRDRIIAVLTVLACLAWVCGAPNAIIVVTSIAAAVAQATRLIGWKPLCTLKNPLLCILHLSYAWIPAGFAFLALFALNIVPVSAGIHALAVGATAGLIIGMITRTALGHTGRPLKAGKAETAMYLLVQTGAILRLAAALNLADARNGTLIASAICWSVAFLIYLKVYGPYLLAARIDNKEG